MGSQLKAPLLLHAAWLSPFPVCCHWLCWHLFFHHPLCSCSAWSHHPRCLLQSHHCPLWFVEPLGFFLGRVQLKYKYLAQHQPSVTQASPRLYSEDILKAIVKAASSCWAHMCHYWNTWEINMLVYEECAGALTHPTLGTAQHRPFWGVIPVPPIARQHSQV